MTKTYDRKQNLPYSATELRPLVCCILVAAVTAAICVLFGPTSIDKTGLVSILRPMDRLVPSIATISSATTDPTASEIILAVQWLFAPAYGFIWFYFYPPWSSRMRLTVANTSRTLSDAKRPIGLVIGILFFGVWILGDLGLIAFPTFYNGKFVYPLGEAVPQLKLIYASRIALAVYAWFGPIVETTIIWMFSLLTLNAKTYFLPQPA